jgi:hypothetical protein
MNRTIKLAKAILYTGLITFLILYCSVIALAVSDQYIEGYIQSIFVHGYTIPKDAVKVHNGVIYINRQKINGHSPDLLMEKVRRVSSSIEGVKGIKLMNYQNYRESNNKSLQTQRNTSKDTEIDGTLPNHPLFEPLIADPKWPRFSLAYHYYLKDRMTKHAFSPNFGASFGLYRAEAKSLEWEIGIQAGLFALMDIGKTPSALINADYFVGLPVSYRSEPWSGLIRLYHVSSHLGDEFMLTPEGKKTQRINLSYEGIDVLLSYNFGNTRFYGGSGYIIHKEPSYYKPLKIQGGVEYYSSTTFLNGRLRPVGGIDIKAEEHGKWMPGISCKAGVQLENSSLISSKVQLMLEFYSGKSIHGQLYKDSVKYIGIGLHAFL